MLATVRGDVHDIGKNLVDIILTNNGYKVYNLGIKQPIGNVINAWREHNADAIGLSGLLVHSRPADAARSSVPASSSRSLSVQTSAPVMRLVVLSILLRSSR